MDLPARDSDVKNLVTLTEQMRRALEEVEQLAQRQLTTEEANLAIDAITNRLLDAINNVVEETGQIVPVLRMN